MTNHKCMRKPWDIVIWASHQFIMPSIYCILGLYGPVQSNSQKLPVIHLRSACHGMQKAANRSCTDSPKSRFLYCSQIQATKNAANPDMLRSQCRHTEQNTYSMLVTRNNLSMRLCPTSIPMSVEGILYASENKLHTRHPQMLLRFLQAQLQLEMPLMASLNLLVSSLLWILRDQGQI